MLHVLSVTGPIYLIILVGYVAVRCGVFEKIELRVIGRFVMQFCLPALLFDAVSRRQLGELLNAPFLAAYAGGSLFAFACGFLYAKRVRRSSLTLAALQGLGSSASNSGFIGYPVAMQVIGPMAGAAAALTIAIENLIMLPLAFALIEADGSGGWREGVKASLQALVRNPLVIAIVAGVLCAAFEWQPPSVIARTMQIGGAAGGPAALFVIGGSLVGLKLGGIRSEIARVTATKLILHPLAVGALLALLPPFDPELRQAALLFAAMPMMSMLPVLAQEHGHEGLFAATLLAATVCSFFTISAALWLIGVGAH